MCSFIKTCTAGAPAATQRPEKSVNKNSIRWRQYTNTKNGTTHKQIANTAKQIYTGTINRKKIWTHTKYKHQNNNKKYLAS